VTILYDAFSLLPVKPQYSLGILGAGMYGKIFMRALSRDPRSRISWVCSASSATTEAAAAEFGVPHLTRDYRDVLGDPAVDAVVIATPPYLHAGLFVDSVAAGKHVLVEKPLATTPADVARIVDAARSHPQLVIMEASCRHARLQRKFEVVREMIRSGRLGEIYHIHHTALGRGTFVEYNKNGAWGMNKKLAGGGPLLDWGVYDLSFHLGLLDDVPNLKSVRSFTRAGLRDLSTLAPVCDVEQHGAAWMEFDSGLTYYYERGAGVHGETACETRIHGTKGGLRLFYPSWESAEIEFFYDDGGPRKEIIKVEGMAGADDNAAMASHFLDCLDGKVKPMMTVELAAKHLGILFKILGA
jgi:predicted dehydrogenase